MYWSNMCIHIHIHTFCEYGDSLYLSKYYLVLTLVGSRKWTLGNENTDTWREEGATVLEFVLLLFLASRSAPRLLLQSPTLLPAPCPAQCIIFKTPIHHAISYMPAPLPSHSWSFLLATRPGTDVVYLIITLDCFFISHSIL